MALILEWRFSSEFMRSVLLAGAFSSLAMFEYSVLVSCLWVRQAANVKFPSRLEASARSVSAFCTTANSKGLRCVHMCVRLCACARPRVHGCVHEPLSYLCACGCCSACSLFFLGWTSVHCCERADYGFQHGSGVRIHKIWSLVVLLPFVDFDLQSRGELW